MEMVAAAKVAHTAAHAAAAAATTIRSASTFYEISSIHIVVLAFICIAKNLIGVRYLFEYLLGLLFIVGVLVRMVLQ